MGNGGKVVGAGVVLFATWLIATVSKPAEAAEATASLSGRVTDTGGQPLVGVIVTMAGLTTLTDSSGYYGFTNLVPGIYLIEFSEPGYQTVNE